MPLYQIQFCGNAARSFTFQVLTSVKDMLEKGDDQEVKTLSVMESKWHVGIITGAPQPAGRSDPDKVGIAAWTPALYCGGIIPVKGLEVIHKTLEMKAQGQRFAQTLPQLKVWTPGALAFQLPDPWTACKPTEIVPPAPFNVQPPRGKRHVLAQLELQPNENVQDSDEEEPTKYMLSFLGGIYPFREAFDHHQIVGVQVTKTDGEKDYIRVLDNLDPNDGKAEARIRVVLGDILSGMPVYLVNKTPRADLMAALVLSMESIVHGEDEAP